MKLLPFIGLAFYGTGIAIIIRSGYRIITSQREIRKLDAQSRRLMAEADKEFNDLLKKIREDQKTARIKMDGSGIDEYAEYLMNKYNIDNPNKEN